MSNETKSKIYRVMVLMTGSLQPNCTHWRKEVLYCGPDLVEARTAYLKSEPYDIGERGCWGVKMRRTNFQQFDAIPENVDDFTPEEVT